MSNIKSVAIGIRNINTKSGLGKIVLEQIKYYQNNNIQIDIYTNKYDSMIKKTGVNIIKILKIPFLGEYYQRLFFAKVVERKIINKNYDLVIGHGDLIKQDIIFLHNLVEKAYFLTHNKVMEPLDNIAKIRRLILSQQKFKLLIANSELMKNELIESFKIAKEKIKVIYPGYDPLQFNVEGKITKRDLSRNELNIDKDTRLIGFITSGNFKKRALDIFIKALSKIQTDIDYKILLVGTDSNLPKYLEITKEYGLENKFILKEPIDNVEKYFYAVDFTVHPAYFEEFGMVVQEAMACGLPVITSKRVGASEIMIDKTTVMEYPNIDDLVLLMQRLLNDDTLRDELSKSSLESVKNTTWKAYMDNFIMISKELVC